MKTAVSIPDHVFRAAETLADRLGISRSELFARALAAYTKAHQHDRVREALDLVYDEEHLVWMQPCGRCSGLPFLTL